MWDTIDLPDGSGVGAGGWWRPAAALLFLQTHVPGLWLSPQTSHYKNVSCVGNGKRAKKTIWPWEGIWAVLELGRRLGPPEVPITQWPACPWPVVGDFITFSSAPAPL